MSDLQEFDFSPLFTEELDCISHPEIKLNESNDTKRLKKAQGKVKVSVVIDQPRWRLLSSTDFNLAFQPGSTFFLVRLGFQFPDLGNELVINQTTIQTFLEGPINRLGVKPKVAEIFPTEVFEGNLQKVNLKLSPKLKFMNSVELSVGEGAFQSNIGQIAPEIIGWTGEEERSPYWKVKPLSKKLVGLRHFWMIVERPEGCDHVQLSILLDLVLDTRKFGILPIGRRNKERSFLRAVEICRDL